MAFHYSEELAHPVHGRGAGLYWLSIQDQGHVGIVIGIALAVLLALFAANSIWRFFTRLPAVILMPDRLWIHPSFGRKPIPYSNIVCVSLDRVGKSQIAMNILTEEPIERNWMFWVFGRSPYRFSIGEVGVDASLFGLARFRNLLAQKGSAARAAVHEKSERP